METTLIYAKDGKKYAILESSGNLSKSRLASDESDWPEWRKTADFRTETVKTPRVPTWQRQLSTTAGELPAVDIELLSPAVATVSDVRVIAPGRLEDEARQLFDRLGIIYPEGWRGTAFGKRGGTEEQRSLSAVVSIPVESLTSGLVLALEATGAKIRDGIVSINNFEYALQLLVSGREVGWRITKNV